jgi:heptosyltransferase-2
MSELKQYRQSEKLLVVMPTWVGDCVMAVPTLRAFRQLYPNAHIAALIKEGALPIIEDCPYVNQIIPIRKRPVTDDEPRGGGPMKVARYLSKENFDTAILLPNSFRTALMARMSLIPRRVGYDRDGRGFLLTDRLMVRRENGKFIPVSTLDYYLGIARYLGAQQPSHTMELFTNAQDDANALDMLKQGGWTPDCGKPLVMLNPGARYGEAKMWYPDRFAQVAKMCVEKFDATIAITGAPRERNILDEVISSTDVPMIDLPKMGMDLRTLKSVVKHATLMVSNDTGPRHIAAAFGVPVVTVFGPTDPRWTEIDFEHERIVRVDVFCGPCQKRTCPLDHRCMTQVTPEMVFEQVQELLSANSKQEA